MFKNNVPIETSSNRFADQFVAIEPVDEFVKIKSLVSTLIK